MKRTTLLILALLTVLSSCNDNKEELGGPVEEAYNLLRFSSDIPSECKPPLASENVRLEFNRFKAKVRRCITMTADYPELNNFETVDECLVQIGKSFKAVSRAECRQTVLNPDSEGSAPDAMLTLLDNYFKVKVVDVNSDDALDWQGMTGFFNLIGSWFDQTRGVFYPISEDQFISDIHFLHFQKRISTPLWNAISNHESSWKESFGEIIKPVSGVDDSGNPLDEETILKNQISKNKSFQIYKTMLQVNQKFLTKLFDSNLALDAFTWKEGLETHASPLLASFLGDALSPLFERTQAITRIYDIACKLKPCSHDFYQKNSTYWLLKFMDSLLHEGELEALSYEPRNIELASFLDTLEINKSIIRSLVQGINGALSVSNFATAYKGSDYPKILDSFKRIFNETHTLLSNYENSKVLKEDGSYSAGYFSSDSISDINVGFSNANIDRHIKNVELSNSKLIALRESFNTKKHTLIRETLAFNGAKVELSQLEGTINDLVTDMFIDKKQIDVVRDFITDSSVDYAKEVKALLSNPNLADNAKQFVLERERRFTLDASSIPQDTGDGEINSVYLVKVPSAAMKKGDILQFNVENEWSPTCAISRDYGDNLIRAKSGPRGFALTQTDGKAEVHSVNKFKSKQTTKMIGASASLCGGVSLKNRGLIGSAQACVNTSISTSWTNGKTTSDMNSTSKRSDATFDLGLTLSGTPYPYLPVGSLILVEMAPGVKGRNDYRNTYILKQHSSFVISNSNSEYYIVGNDCYSSSNSGELFVTLQHLKPQGDQSFSYVDKMLGVMSNVEGRAQSLIEVGQLSFDMKESIKSQLKGSVGGTSLENFTGQVRNLLDSYIMNQVSVLSYKSQLVQMERSLDAKMRKLTHLLDQYESEGQQVELRAYTRNWLLSNLDLDFMNKTEANKDLYNLNKILDVLENNLVSYLDFKYRNDEKDYILGDLDLLQQLDLADSFDQISENLSTFVQVLVDNIRQDLENNPKVPKTVVGIKIPNPYYEPTFDLPLPEFSLHPVMNETKAKIFWDNLMNWKSIGEMDLAFNIEVEDLYGSEGLGCYVQTPIIETMGLYFIPENEGYVSDFNNNYQYQNAKLYLDGLSYMPFEDKLREYNFVNDNWRYMDVAVRMAKSDDDAMRLLTSEFPPEATHESGLGTGRPPFGKFVVGKLRPWRDFNGQIMIGRTPVTEVKELFVAYVISANNSNYNVNLGWIPHCAIEGI